MITDEYDELHLESPGAEVAIRRDGERTVLLAAKGAAIRIPIADLGDVALALRGELGAFAHQAPSGADRVGLVIRRSEPEASLVFTSIARGSFTTLAAVALAANDADRLACLIEHWLD